MQTDSLETIQSTTQEYVHWFRHSAPYINAHRGKTFVLMFGGEAVEHENFQHIIHDIALLHSFGHTTDFGPRRTPANYCQFASQ